ncbi:MAG TPA: NUDIX hydrolase [Acidobacteriota bacterium]
MRLLESKKIYSGKIVDLVVDYFEKDDGEHTVREVVRHPGGVAVVAELNGRILFVRQRRYPMDIALLELPAGKLDGQENPELAARRELEEETGYRARRLRKIGAFYTSPGFCDELIHIYMAEGLEEAAQQLEWDEDIQLELHALDAALQMIATGEICDAKTAVGLLWLALEKNCSAGSSSHFPI